MEAEGSETHHTDFLMGFGKASTHPTIKAPKFPYQSDNNPDLQPNNYP